MTLENFLYFRDALTKNNKVIRIPKIRTMKIDSNSDFKDLINSNGLSLRGKIENDPRVTPVGKVLRKYWIDETPQLFYIFTQINLVGIRPKEISHWNLYPKTHKDRCLKYKPGLLGVPYVLDDERISKSTNVIKTFQAIERLYCMKKSKNPIKTDFEFGFKILYNIFIKGIRSK